MPRRDELPPRRQLGDAAARARAGRQAHHRFGAEAQDRERHARHGGARHLHRRRRQRLRGLPVRRAGPRGQGGAVRRDRHRRALLPPARQAHGPRRPAPGGRRRPAGARHDDAGRAGADRRLPRLARGAECRLDRRERAAAGGAARPVQRRGPADRRAAQARNPLALRRADRSRQPALLPRGARPAHRPGAAALAAGHADLCRSR